MRGNTSCPRIRLLPIEFQCKLGLPPVANSVVYRSKRVTGRVVQEIRVSDTRPKIGVVEEVEKLSTEFKVGVFRSPEFLKD